MSSKRCFIIIYIIKVKIYKIDVNNAVNFNNEIKFDVLNKTLLKRNELVKLTNKELLFLEICLKNTNRAITYKELENFISSLNIEFIFFVLRNFI